MEDMMNFGSLEFQDGKFFIGFGNGKKSQVMGNVIDSVRRNECHSCHVSSCPAPYACTYFQMQLAQKAFNAFGYEMM